MALVDRLEALAAAGYTVGIGASDDHGEPLSYRVSGFGIDLTIPAADADAFLDSIDATHDDRAADEEKTEEQRVAESDAIQKAEAAKIQTRLDAIDAKIDGTALPAGVKAILKEIADAAIASRQA